MDLNVVQNSLKSCTLFRSLDKGQLGLLAMTATERAVASGDIVYQQGEDAAGKFGLIVSGKMDVLTGKGLVLKTLGAGEIIGEVGSISQQGKRTVTVKASEPAVIFEWRIQDINEHSPALFKNLKDLAWRRIKDWHE